MGDSVGLHLVGLKREFKFLGGPREIKQKIEFFRMKLMRVFAFFSNLRSTFPVLSYIVLMTAL